MKRMMNQWESFKPTEKLEKTYLRQKKLERIFLDE